MKWLDKTYKVVGFVFIVLFTISSINSAISLVSWASTASAAQSKNDPCRQYQKKAEENLEKATGNNHSVEYKTWYASLSAAYSGQYLVCRDPERQR